MRPFQLAASIISKLPARYRRAAVEAGLLHLERITYERLSERGFRPGGVIDIGAHCGEWTKSASAVFSSIPFFMIEARPEMAEQLKEVVASHPSFDFAIALLGARERDSVPFHNHDTGSSIFAERSDIKSSVTNIAMTTLDNIAPASLSSPLFLKVDVQGAEIEILKGGSRTLEKAEIVQLELPLLSYNDGAPTSTEAINFMDQHGFAMYDIPGFIRPYGKHLVQIDVIFVRENSKLRPKHFEFNGQLPDFA